MMQHPDEYSLELYVLGSGVTESKREEIRSHLEICHGCRSLAETMGLFYSKAQEELHRPSPALPSSLPVKRSIGSISIPDRKDAETGMEITWPPRGHDGAVIAFLRRYPIAASIGSVGLAAALVLAGMMIASSLKRAGPTEITDHNPAFQHINPVTESIEVLNAENERLWQKQAPGVGVDPAREVALHGAMSAIADLDADGTNEVITGLAIVGHGAEVKRNTLIVWDAYGNVLWEKLLDANVQYLDRTNYTPHFSLQCLVVIDAPDGKGKNIFIAANNIGRSPAIVQRYNANGELLGSYWHFGVIHAMEHQSINGSSRLLLVGKNDVEDTTAGEFAFIDVLDPDKISGERRATTCPGYHLPPSDAEEYYVKVPRVDFDLGLETSSGFRRIVDQDSLTWRFELGGERSWTFDYILDHRMAVVEVKSYDQNRELRNRLLAEGKVRGEIDAEYLERLRKNVFYWDGTRWGREVTTVQHVVPRPQAQ